MSKPTASLNLNNKQNSKPVRHSFFTRIFHHSSAIIILVLWMLAELDDEFDTIIPALGVHKAIGVLFLIWIIARLINAIFRGRLPTPSQPKWQVAIAHLVHFGLYASMIGMALSGTMMSLYGGRAVDVFGLFSIPVFVEPNRKIAGVINEIHTDILFPLLITLILVHIGGAVYHQIVLKDKLINRMM